MAKKVVTTTEYTDDLDGSKAEGTIAFTIDGTSYEIDLSKKNRTAFEKAIKPYVDAARKVRASRGRAGNRPASRRSNAGAAREWAKKNGYELAARGRIPVEVMEAYNAAN